MKDANRENVIEQDLTKGKEWEAMRNKGAEGDVYADDEEDKEDEQNREAVKEVVTKSNSSPSKNWNLKTRSCDKMVRGNAGNC